MILKCNVEFSIENHEDENGNGIFDDEKDFFEYVEEIFRNEIGASYPCTKDWKHSSEINYRFIPEEELNPDCYTGYWDNAAENPEDI